MHPEANCPGIEADLTAYRQDELAPARRAEVEAHLAACAACARAASEVESVFALAGSIEDLAPSLRFKRNLASLVARSARPVVEEAGLLRRVRLAGAYFADRLRTSRRFRLATVSVGLHVALLLVISLVVIPRVVEKRQGGVPDDWAAKYHRDPVLPDEVRGPLAGPLPAPEPAEEGRPEMVETSPFPRDVRHDLEPLEPFLPPRHRPTEQPLAGLLATSLPDEVKLRRMAACLEDPEPAIAAAARGLAYLAGTQEEDGSWAPGTNGAEYRTGVTAVALLAFLSDGHSETRGRREFRAVVERGVSRLLADQHREGEHAGLIGPARGHFAYNHALATMALVEAWALDARRAAPARSAEQRRAIRLALDYIERRQVPEGGWRYGGEPNPSQVDSSVAVFTGVALASARSARFVVSDGTFDRLSGWLRSVTTESGAVGYRAADDRIGSAGTRTAGALFLEETLGIAAPVRGRQAELVGADLRDANRTKDDGLLRFWSALAFRARGTPVLDRFATEMLAVQREDGSWSSERDEWAVYGGDSFLTALNVLTLTSAYRFPG